MFDARGAAGSDPSSDGFGRLIAWFGAVWVCTAAALWCAVRFHVLGGGSVDPLALLRAAVFGLALVLVLSLPARAAVAGLAVLVGALVLGRHLPVVADGVVALACIGLGLRLLRGVALQGWLVVAVVAMLAALRHMSMILSLGYAVPMSQELALVGLQHKDTLFHAAIAALFAETGEVSIGLNGLVALHYHILSHVFVGGFAGWIGRPVLQAYGLFVPVLGGAAMFVAFLAALRAVAGRRVPQGPVVALVLPVVAVAASDRLMASFWASESYLVSVMLMCLAVALAAEAIARGAVGVGAVLLLALLAGMTALAKISTGAVLVCGLVPMLVMAGGWRWRGFVSAGAVAAPFVAVYVLTFSNAEAGGSMIAPFAYYAGRATALGLVLLALAGFASVRAWRNHRGNPVLVGLCFMAWAGFGAGLLLDLAAGATGYFVGPGLWAALLAVLALVLRREAPLPKWTLRVVVTLFALMVTGGIGGRSADRLADYAVALQGTAAEARMTTGVYVRIAAAVRDDPSIAAVHVDPKAAGFWSGGVKTCWAPSLTVQALTGRPVLGAIVPEEYGCISPAPYYGWGDYDPAKDSAVALSPDGICAAAEPWGFAKVLEVAADESLWVVSCDAGCAGPVLRVSDGVTP